MLLAGCCVVMTNTSMVVQSKRLPSHCLRPHQILQTSTGSPGGATCLTESFVPCCPAKSWRMRIRASRRGCPPQTRTFCHRVPLRPWRGGGVGSDRLGCINQKSRYRRQYRPYRRHNRPARNAISNAAINRLSWSRGASTVRHALRKAGGCPTTSF